MKELIEFIEKLKEYTSPRDRTLTSEELQFRIYDACGEWLEKYNPSSLEKNPQ